MKISFERRGVLGEVLKSFKSDFLASLSQDDLKREVTLLVSDEGRPGGPKRDGSTLAEQILEVLSGDEAESRD